MTNPTTMAQKIHEGNNVKRIREFLGMKQDMLADKLGDDWNQQKVSLLEQKEKIEPEIAKQVAMALGVSPEAIRNLTEEMAITIINSFNDHSVNNSNVGCYNYFCTFNPLDKILELFERMLQENKETIEELKSEIKSKK